MNTRRKLLVAPGAGALAVPSVLFAQQHSSKIRHIAYLSQGSERNRAASLGAFRDGLREFGWIDGENIIIDLHFAQPYEFPQIAASLVKRNPAVIVGTCIPSTRAAKGATTTIPVVMSVNGDPVQFGLVASLARPGANVTGTSTLFEELIPKWFELITTTVPNTRTIAVIANPAGVSDEYWWAQVQQAAERIRVTLVRAEAPSAAGLDRAFASTSKQRAGAWRSGAACPRRPARARPPWRRCPRECATTSVRSSPLPLQVDA